MGAVLGGALSSVKESFAVEAFFLMERPYFFISRTLFKSPDSFDGRLRGLLAIKSVFPFFLQVLGAMDFFQLSVFIVDFAIIYHCRITFL